MTICPPFLARQSVNNIFSPVVFECFSYRCYSSLDVLLGAKPKIPLAACVKNRLVSLVVQPKLVMIPSPGWSFSNSTISCMMTPSSELPSA